MMQQRQKPKFYRAMIGYIMFGKTVIIKAHAFAERLAEKAQRRKEVSQVFIVTN